MTYAIIPLETFFFFPCILKNLGPCGMKIVPSTAGSVKSYVLLGLPTLGTVAGLG